MSDELGHADGLPSTTEVTLRYIGFSSDDDTSCSASGYSNVSTSGSSATYTYMYGTSGKDMLKIEEKVDEEDENCDPLSDYSSYNNPYIEKSRSAKGEISSPFERDREISEITRSHSFRNTRQMNIYIGEELENIQSTGFPKIKSFSCPPSPRIQKEEIHAIRHQPVGTLHDVRQTQGRGVYPHDPLHHFLIHLPEEEVSVTCNEFLVKPNPYNNINHMFHSALHCPCFLFFFFLCCLPGIHWMQLGDIEYQHGQIEKAKSLGRKATVSYVVGIVLGVLFLAGAITLTVQFVQSQEN